MLKTYLVFFVDTVYATALCNIANLLKLPENW